MQSNKDYVSILHDVHELLMSTQKGKRLLVESNVLNQILNLTLDVANDEAARLTERQVAFSYMVEVWKSLPEFV